MLKKIFTLTLFLFLSACGYEAIHSKKNSINYDFAISKLTFIGNRDVNLKIKEKLNNYTLAKKNKSFQLRVSSTNEKLVLAKDISGDPTSFKSTIIITVQVFIEGNLRNDLQITEDFNYNNNCNKFYLNRYEKEIINNIAETAADKLIFKLSNIQ